MNELLITEEFLINAGFEYMEQESKLCEEYQKTTYGITDYKLYHKWTDDKHPIKLDIDNGWNNRGTKWSLHIDNDACETIGCADIDYTWQFNKLMEVFDSSLRLPEEDVLIQRIFFLIAQFWFDIKSQIRKYRTYTLTDEETKLWENIKQKANNGYSEFCDECKKDPDYWGWPWMSPNLTAKERALVDKIHAVYFGKDYYLTDPIGVAQGDWAFYDDIKDKVR